MCPHPSCWGCSQADFGRLNPVDPDGARYRRVKGKADTEGTASFRAVGRQELFKPVEDLRETTRSENIARGCVPQDEGAAERGRARVLEPL